MNEWDRLHRQAERNKKLYPSGTRIEMNHMSDPFAPIPNGMKGTVVPAETKLTTEGTKIAVSVPSLVIPYGNQLTVSVSSSNYADSKWHLVESENASNKLEYSIKNGENAVASGDAILTVAAGATGEQKVTLTAALVGTATYSGTYKDTLTFTVSVGTASTNE